MKNLFKTIALFALCITAVSCDNNDSAPQEQTITNIAANNTDLTILITALERTGLANTLDQPGQFTVFAPTNQAFKNYFSSSIFAQGVNVNNVNVDILRNLLLNHVIASEINSTTLSAATYVSTLSPFNTTPTSQTISMFVQKTGADVIINGGRGIPSARRKGAKVVTADVEATNGVIHIVDAVIQIPTILDHAVNNPNFSTLVAVVTSTGAPFGNQSAVATALSTATAAAPLTVFAPLNTAFVEAQATGGFLTGANVTAANVTRVLQYHVLAGNVRSSAITTTIQTLPTLATNPQLNVRVQLNPTAKVTDTQNVVADIVVADVQGSNGVVHAVNKVLRPF